MALEISGGEWLPLALRRQTHGYRSYVEMGQWFSSRGERAAFVVFQAGPGAVFTEDSLPSFEQMTKDLLGASTIRWGESGESVGVVGDAEYRRFEADGSDCFFSRQGGDQEYYDDVRGGGGRILGTIVLDGLVCAPRGDSLTTSDIEESLRGVGVKGFAVP